MHCPIELASVIELSEASGRVAATIDTLVTGMALPGTLCHADILFFLGQPISDPPAVEHRVRLTFPDHTDHTSITTLNSTTRSKWLTQPISWLC